MVEIRAFGNMQGIDHRDRATCQSPGLRRTFMIPVLDAHHPGGDCCHGHPRAIEGAVVIELEGNFPAPIAHLGQLPAHVISYRKR